MRSSRRQIAAALREFAAGHSPVPVQLPQSFAVRNAVEWGLGVDYTWEGYLFLLQVNQTDILHNDVDLLIKNVDTVLLANLRKNFLHDDLTAQLIAIQGFESGYTLLMPRIDLSLLGSLRGARRLPVHLRPPELRRSASTRTTTRRSSGCAILI